MTSSLAAYLKAEIDARGWSDAQTAEKAGLTKSSLSYILNTPNMIPELQTLDRLAVALGIPLARLITMAGFSIDNRPDISADEQITEILRALPELRGLVDDLQQLRAQDLAIVRAYVDGYLRRLRETEA
jgi:transcriptional regulator with XRE-family HTH domain